MENYLRRITISDLFEEGNNYKIILQEGCNCIYGGNGTGKTTIINLIVASLSSDIDSLAKIPFSKLIVHTSKTKKRMAEKFIEITKSFDGERNKIEFLIEDKTYTFEDANQKSDIRNKKALIEDIEKIKLVIQAKINLTHVPLLRIHDSEEIAHREVKTEWINRIFDLKSVPQSQLREIIDPSVRVLGSLQRQFILEANENRKKINLDLEVLKSKIIEKVMIDDALVRMSSRALKKAHSAIYENIEDVDVEAHIKKLSEAKINVPADKIQEHFTNWKKLNDNVKSTYEALRRSESNPDSKKKQEVTANFNTAYYNFIAMANFNERFTSIVSDVEKMQEKKIELTTTFTDYEREVNEFISPRKNFRINEDGQFKISSSARTIDINDLSSGEKHILTILGKSALSRRDGTLFIADEPELSLHLEWQRKILPSIMRLSPKSQIIVATHSPAIIARNAHEISLEDCRK